MAATDFETAVDQTITASNQLHEVVNGTSTETVTTDSGEIPSVRKALTDSMMYLPSIPWAQGEGETNLFQPRIFGDQIYWAPNATSVNPTPMGTSPVGDSNWFLAPVSLNKNFVANTFNYDGLIYQGIGNISDFAGQQLQEAGKTNAYQYPDDSRQFYAPDKSQAFPITIPSNPSSDGKWVLVNALTSSSLSAYTYIVYDNVTSMITGNPIDAVVGDICQTSRTLWKRISDASGDISDFKEIGPVDVEAFGEISNSSSLNNHIVIAAIDYCKSSGAKLIGSGTIKLEGSGDIDFRGVEVEIDGILDFTGDTSWFCVIGGDSNSSLNKRQLITRIRSDEARDENTPLCVIKGTKNQDITIDVCASLKLDVENADSPTNSSIGYSNFWLNYINILNIQGAAQGASSQAGWVNENTFYLKRCTKLIVGDEDPDTYSHNNNIFHGGTFEGGSTITFNAGNDNTMNSVRLESADDNAISFSSRTVNNKVIVSWVESFADQPVYDWNYTDLGRGNIVFSNDNAAYSEYPVFALNSEILLFDNDATPTKCNIQGVGNWTNISESGTPTGAYYLTKSGQDISCTTFSVICRSPRLQISTTKDSLITISSGGWSGGGYRLIVHGYDNDGNVMTPGSEDVIAVGFPASPFGSQIQTANVTNSRLYINRAGCRFISISVICGSVAASFRWLNVSLRNPKVTTRTNGAEVRLPSSYVVPFNTPKLN